MKDAIARLKRIRESLGVGLIDWRPHPYEPRNKKVLQDLEKGVRPRLREELGQISNVGGLLSYKGEQCVIYIKDTRQGRVTLENNPQESPRFHLSECETINQMRTDRRFERYVITNRTDGKFKVEAAEKNEELEVTLYPCKNCLDYLSYAGYRRNLRRDRQLIIQQEFDLKDFFAKYETFFVNKPRHSDITAPIGGYVQGWNKISWWFREQKNWTCEECGVNLRDYTKKLHAHHINGVTSDNSPQNLRALCVVCHEKQPRHRKMATDEDRKLIARLLANNPPPT